MTACEYAKISRPTMWPASEALVANYKAGQLRLHHDALVIGYTSVKGDEYAAYDGRFGRGVAVFSNYTCAYSRVSYYVEVE